MKQLIIISILYLFGLSNIQAEEISQYEETTWNVIRERLFNGKNTHVFRYENDIRIQIKGLATKQDSAFFINLIEDLSDLLELVEVKMVNDEPNLSLKIVKENGLSMNSKQTHSGSVITYTSLELGLPDTSHLSQYSNRIHYYTLRKLVKLFDPRFGHTGYGGIFDSSKPEGAKLHEIDKDLLRKVYSLDFYKQLKKNSIKRKSFFFYLNFRFNNLMRNLFLSVAIILAILGFLFFLSKETKREKNPTLWRYLKDRFLLLVVVAICYQLPQMHADVPVFHWKSNLLIFLGVTTVTCIYGILVLLIIYYVEGYFLKRIKGFISKQIFIFLNTIVSIFSIVAILSVLVSFKFSIPSSVENPSSPLTSSMLQNTTKHFLIIFIASIRILYNFLNYKLRGIVNAKDVELAKMKELKNQAELNALHSRINPHFLYNSLNSIAVLAHTNPDKTENMATGLSELFRYSINKENKTFVTIEDELEMVKRYLEIEKTRFEDRLNYKIEIEERANKKLIPKFLIQPLAENAIKHGLSKSKEAGEIFIQVKQKERDLIIAIFDSGPDFPDEPVSGYGLQNLHDKLQILYGDDAFVNWENGEEKHFKITLKNQF